MIPKVVLDTNILISAIIFGGKPRDILQLVLHKRIIAVTSPSLITELGEVLIKKFDFLPERVQLIVKKLKRNFKVVNPSVGIHILKDPGLDNISQVLFFPQTYLLAELFHRAFSCNFH